MYVARFSTRCGWIGGAKDLLGIPTCKHLNVLLNYHYWSPLTGFACVESHGPVGRMDVHKARHWGRPQCEHDYLRWSFHSGRRPCSSFLLGELRDSPALSCHHLCLRASTPLPSFRLFRPFRRWFLPRRGRILPWSPSVASPPLVVGALGIGVGRSPPLPPCLFPMRVACRQRWCWIGRCADGCSWPWLLIVCQCVSFYLFLIGNLVSLLEL